MCGFWLQEFKKVCGFFQYFIKSVQFLESSKKPNKFDPHYNYFIWQNENVLGAISSALTANKLPFSAAKAYTRIDGGNRM
jgi:hypothetical protein